MLKRMLFSLALLVAASAALQAQSSDKNLWKTLGNITYKKQYDELLGFKVDVPVFAAEVRALEGKVVELKGYIVPVEGFKSHKEFVFSAFPYNMCFFCGGAGPETVMEVKASEGIKFTTEPIVIRGVLGLNDSDVNHLMYQLTDAELVRSQGK